MIKDTFCKQNTLNFLNFEVNIFIIIIKSEIKPNFNFIIFTNTILTFDYVIFAAQALRHLRIKESDETECPERFRNEHVGNLTELPKVLPQIVRGQILRTPAYEYFARHLLYQSFLGETVEKSAVKASDR